MGHWKEGWFVGESGAELLVYLYLSFSLFLTDTAFWDLNLNIYMNIVFCTMCHVTWRRRSWLFYSEGWWWGGHLACLDRTNNSTMTFYSWSSWVCSTPNFQQKLNNKLVQQKLNNKIVQTMILIPRRLLNVTFTLFFFFFDKSGRNFYLVEIN